MAEKILTAVDIVARVIKGPDGRVIDTVRLKDTADFEQLNKETQARHGKLGQKARAKIRAYISDNRWVADCSNCNSGIALHPDVNLVVCLECGESYTVTWPKDRDKVEEALVCRPRKNRHWFPHETVDDLHRQNEEHIDAIRTILANEGIEATPEVASKIARAMRDSTREV